MAVQPLVFLAIYSSMTLPTVPFVQLYGVGVLVVWYCTSLGTLVRRAVGGAGQASHRNHWDVEACCRSPHSEAELSRAPCPTN